MRLVALDWFFIFGFFAIALVVGLWSARKAGRNSSEFFLSGRHMPWWLLGFSMVATTFSTDTPNLVTDIVRKNGVAGNWVWWAFLLTGMLTVFIYARLWRRSKVLTDVEFYEIRYSGRAAAFMRGFRALYLGILFNVMVMAAVTLAAIKIGGVMLGYSPLKTIFLASLITVIFSTLGGLRGILLTDFLLFIIAIIGAFAAAVVAVNHPDIGGLRALLSHPNVSDKLALVPQLVRGADGAITKDSLELMITVFIMPIAVQWWSVWYPGAEPGGGSYLAQRMLAAKDEKHATGAVLFFNVAHYALRPWPWILVALCSLVVFPDLAAIRDAFPHVQENIINDDLAYPAMLTFLPHGWLGFVLASLIAAYMSTISTQLNLGSSYVVNDFYKRFVRKQADEKELVLVGRICTVILMVLAALLALKLENSLKAFRYLIMIGAGTGLLYILRWFWWRVNAVAELTAMVVSFCVAFTIEIILPEGTLAPWAGLLVTVSATTVAWIAVALLTRPAPKETLRSFCELVNAGGPGWRKVYVDAEREGRPLKPRAKSENLPVNILCMVLGTFLVYSALFGAGMWLYGRTVPAIILTVVAAASAFGLAGLWGKANER